MKIYEEKALKDFEFWGGAVVNAKMLTEDEIDELENVLEQFDKNFSDTEINDLMWFDFEWVCDAIGLVYDVAADEIIRD